MTHIRSPRVPGVGVTCGDFHTWQTVAKWESKSQLMEETSIVWSTESLFPDLHPTVVDTSHSRTLDASTCLRILLIPRSILFCLDTNRARVQPSLRLRRLLHFVVFLPCSSSPILSRLFLVARNFHKRWIYLLHLLSYKLAIIAGEYVRNDRFLLEECRRAKEKERSERSFHGLVLTVLLQSIFESSGKTGVSTWSNDRGLFAGPRRLPSRNRSNTAIPGRNVEDRERDK